MYLYNMYMLHICPHRNSQQYWDIPHPALGTWRNMVKLPAVHDHVSLEMPSGSLT
jgi:hypothetical protein